MLLAHFGTKKGSAKQGIFEYVMSTCLVFDNKCPNIYNCMKSQTHVGCYDFVSSGLWTPNAVMKTFTTTMMKTRAVTMFSRRFSM